MTQDSVIGADNLICPTQFRGVNGKIFCRLSFLNNHYFPAFFFFLIQIPYAIDNWYCKRKEPNEPLRQNPI